ncbi:hypothetical protein PspLS_01837 [Pyricularia sp. CBS 133598]|nr:hypothetical protein PspLS_01837 [Pyricularia sp. CBS 133598]
MQLTTLFLAILTATLTVAETADSAQAPKSKKGQAPVWHDDWQEGPCKNNQNRAERRDSNGTLEHKGYGFNCGEFQRACYCTCEY